MAAPSLLSPLEKTVCQIDFHEVDLRGALKKHFGHSDFKPKQREIIETLLDKKDVLGVLPTGGGKSICYQLPSLFLPKLTLVISPLISLMHDQVSALLRQGLKAAMLHSGLDEQRYIEEARKVRFGGTKLLYMSPETLEKKKMQTWLKTLGLSLIAVDEAHCVSEWGHQFRPEYKLIVKTRDLFSQVPLVALTATATTQVRRDIESSLGMKKTVRYVSGFDRPNLTLEVQKKENEMVQLMSFLKGHQGESGIIYCASRDQVEKLSAMLASRGFSVLPYHAGFSDESREKHQDAFLREKTKIIVATIAFGMGIDKPNVRFVVHYQIPKNLESYYQEIGRAGRDGKPAHCLLLYHFKDFKKTEFLLKKSLRATHLKRELNKLKEMNLYAQIKSCKRKFLLNYFGEKYSACTMCKVCPL